MGRIVADNWEDTLRKWKNPPSENEKSKRDRTENQIRDALKAANIAELSRASVYSKGSYANNTNVRLDYDVDIAVECREFFYSDLVEGVSGFSKPELGIFDYTGDYSVEKFKNDVETGLVDAFGRRAVQRGKIAFRVRESKTTLPADVVPCFQYKLVHSVGYPSENSYVEGHCVFPKNGSMIKNYPKQQVMYGTAKNDRTMRRYKRLVRILKHLENRLSKEGVIEDLPSYFIECLVYNVPDQYFGNDKYLDDLQNVLAVIYNETKNQAQCKDWIEVNEVKYLFYSSQNWTYSDAHTFAHKAWDYIGFS
jgi:hypothetical protein